MYQNELKEIHGVWFFEAKDMQRFHDQITNLKDLKRTELGIHKALGLRKKALSLIPKNLDLKSFQEVVRKLLDDEIFVQVLYSNYKEL